MARATLPRFQSSIVGMFSVVTVKQFILTLALVTLGVVIGLALHMRGFAQTHGESGSTGSGSHQSGSGKGAGHAGGATGHTGGEGAGKGTGHTGGTTGHTGGETGHSDKGSEGGKGKMGAHGGEHAAHGTRPGHAGHTSGVHNPTADSHEAGHGRAPQLRARAGYGYTDNYFGGGARLGGSEHVPEGIGGFGHSFGPGPAYHLRYRYWGGRVIPPDDEPNGETPATETVLAPTGRGGGAVPEDDTLSAAGRCDDVIDPEARQPFSARNIMRLEAVHNQLAPEFDIKRTNERQAALFALAIYQQEMLQREPDTGFAGSYLGSVAKVVVIPPLVAKADFILCLNINDALRASVVQSAERQRTKLAAYRP